jgi:hypothetical protein
VPDLPDGKALAVSLVEVSIEALEDIRNALLQATTEGDIFVPLKRHALSDLHSGLP